MRKIDVAVVFENTRTLARAANMHLRPDMIKAVRAALRAKTSSRSRAALRAILDNAARAQKDGIALCQDTGLPVVFVELGHEVHCARPLPEVIIAALRQGYRDAYLRASIHADPFRRSFAPAYAPALVHIDIVRGRRLKITLLPKGFGSENKSRVHMFEPTAGQRQIEDYVVESVRLAGASACPPYVVGVGIGGTQDSAGLLAKKVLLKNIRAVAADPHLAAFERRILRRINRLGIGPMGFGGRTTALAVRAQSTPTHIAGLPVAVNISCHALRSATVVL